MPHYALLDENNVVVRVINSLIDENDTSNLAEEFSSWEEFYGNFLGGTCKRTSINTFQNQHLALNETGDDYVLSDTQEKAFRGNYAGVGFTYNETEDIFLPPKPYNSWVLDTDNAKWKAPLDYPDDGETYIWNESAYQADNSTGWEAVE